MPYFKGVQSGSQRGPLARMLIALLLILTAALALIFGVIIVVILLAAAIVFFAFLYLRNRWMRRRLGLDVHPHHRSRESDTGTTIEGEYTVNKSSDDNSERHS